MRNDKRDIRKENEMRCRYCEFLTIDCLFSHNFNHLSNLMFFDG